MSDFPTSVKNFLQLQDGVDKVIAQHPNERGDEITAIETMLGALGDSQAYSDSLKNILINYKQGCKIEKKDDGSIYVRSGELALTDGSGKVRMRRNTSDLTVNFTNLDTGAEASSTLYYVYAVADSSGTTFTVKISTSSSAPSGTTFYKKLGTFYNNGSSNISYVTNLNEKALQSSVSKSVGTNYQAETDGFAVMMGAGSASIRGQLVYLYSDSNSSPSTLRGFEGSGSDQGSGGGLCWPVKAGDYYRGDYSSSDGGSGSLWFVPWY